MSNGRGEGTFRVGMCSKRDRLGVSKWKDRVINMNGASIISKNVGRKKKNDWGHPGRLKSQVH